MEFNDLVHSGSPIPIAVSLLTVIVCLQLASPRAEAAPSGEQIYKENCSSCHISGGNTMNPKKPIKGSDKLATVEKFREYLNKPTGIMPPSPKVANDATTLDALYKYCKSLK